MSIGSNIFRPDGVRVCGVDGNPRLRERDAVLLRVDELRPVERLLEALRVDDERRVVPLRGIVFSF
jgi:hypothetical protein